MPQLKWNKTKFLMRCYDLRLIVLPHMFCGDPELTSMELIIFFKVLLFFSAISFYRGVYGGVVWWIILKLATTH